VSAFGDRAVVGADAKGRPVEDGEGHHLPGCLKGLRRR